MSIIARFRQVSDRFRQRIEASAVHQEHQHLSAEPDETYERDRQIAFQREWAKYSSQLGLHWGPI